MNSQGFLFILLALSGVGAVILFIVAVTQQSKSEHGAGFKQTFYTIVSLAMLLMLVGSTAAILTVVSKRTVFTSADAYQQRFNVPPALYLMGNPNVPNKTAPAVYACTDTCQFTADDKIQVANWQTSYTAWQTEQTTNIWKRDLITPLSFFIVSLPLFILFMILMERGAKSEKQKMAKPSPVRSLYFYFISFTGLIALVVGVGFLINTGLQAWLKTPPINSGAVSPKTIDSTQTDAGVKSIITCAGKCGFTSDQVALANQWITDNQAYLKNSESNKGQYQNDLANTLPIILVSLPLFWYHFARIRKESASETPAIPS